MMKYPFCIHWIDYVFVVSMTFILGGRSLACAEIKGDLALLDKVIEAHEANYEKLKTWAGIAEVHSVRSNKGDESQRSDRLSSVVFALDQDRDSWIFNWTYVKTLHPDLDGKTSGGMFHDKKWHEYWPIHLDQPEKNIVNGKKLVQSINVRSTIPGLNSPASELFHPRYFFTIDGESLGECLRSKQKSLERHRNIFDVEVSEKESKVFLSYVSTGIEAKNRTSFVFDLSQGGNLVLQESQDQSRKVVSKYEWEQKQKVWVPSRFQYLNHFNDGSEKIDRTVVWKESVVNEPFPDEVFSLESMIVLKGAWISESVTGKRWRYSVEKPPNR